MNILPVDRALRLYDTLANRSETKGSREQLSRHLMALYMGGEKDQHRLTVHGLSFLRERDRAIDSKN
jgi:vacuolar-type H+-ATPase subunit B/Vma2